jgi:two-component sensor histidine kinase
LVLNAGNTRIRILRADQLGTSCSSGKDLIQISVRDEGVGLPASFDPPTSKRLGSRLINALAKQLGAELTQPVSAIGAIFLLIIPLG